MLNKDLISKLHLRQLQQPLFSISITFTLLVVIVNMHMIAKMTEINISTKYIFILLVYSCALYISLLFNKFEFKYVLGELWYWYS